MSHTQLQACGCSVSRVCLQARGGGAALVFNHQCLPSLASATSWARHFPYIVSGAPSCIVSVAFTLTIEEAAVEEVRAGCWARTACALTDLPTALEGLGGGGLF